jgi:ATP-binding cassette subfamily E protein 1
VKEGINIYLSGEIPSEKIKFRNESITINKIENLQASTDEKITYSYPAMVKTLDTFRLEVQPG